MTKRPMRTCAITERFADRNSPESMASLREASICLETGNCLRATLAGLRKGAEQLRKTEQGSWRSDAKFCNLFRHLVARGLGTSHRLLETTLTWA